MQEFTFISRQEFRLWLEYHHDKEEGIWLIYFKKHTKVQGITYAEAVEEALCFGWIDSKVRTIDEQRYKQVFTPRRPGSIWSESNKIRVRKLMDAGLMTAAGIKLVEAAKKSGMWQKADEKKVMSLMSIDLKAALLSKSPALENFNNFAPSYQKIYITWVNGAKRPDTIKKRIEKVLSFSLKNQKPTMM